MLQDHVTGKHYRFTPIVYQIIGLMDGKLTVQELWEKATELYEDNAPTQGDMVRILSQLHAADVLLSNISPDTAELFDRYEKHERGKWKQNLRSPLSLRFSLFDPERFLSRTVGIVRPFFSIGGFLIWLIVVGVAVTLACLHWSELTEDVVDRVLSTQNLLLLWFIYPVIKTMHEFGHGYAVKVWGGEVHDIGIMLLVLMPIPYVDASSSSAFPEKWRRIVVGAAGMMVEFFVASLAMILWLNLEQGIVSAIAYNVMLIAGVSTVLFNANPLLRYDGYYIMSDMLEIPNLSQRSVKYLGHVTKRYLLGLKKDEPPYVGPGERFWLITYSIVSFIYRMLVYASIILFIAGKFFVIGVLLAAWAFASMIIIPLFKKISFVLFNPVLREIRIRAVFVVSAISLVVMMLLFFAPFPFRTCTEGVVWAPEESLVRAGTSCFVSSVKVSTNSHVKKGDVLIECRDQILVAKNKVLKAQLRALQARYNAEIYTDRVKARTTKEEVANVRAELVREKERLDDLIISSPCDGVFIVPDAEDLPGHYLRQGELVAYVLDAYKPIVRVVVPQSDINLVRQRNRGIDIRFTEHLEKVYPADIIREVPKALESLPSMTLSSVGGGKVAVDPSDPDGLRPLEKQFQFDLEPADAISNVHIGGRVYVRFNHGFEPLIFQWYRKLRQLFLKRFNV